MIHAFILAGQSNMAGRGFLKDVSPVPSAGIRVLRNGRWQPMSEPVHYDRPFAGIGPGASFAYAWKKDHPDEDIGLIPCADGGSTVSEWMPGEQLFRHLMMQAELAEDICQIDGILWHQGETDCHEDSINVYEEKLERILDALRQKESLKSVPFLIGGLGDYLSESGLSEDFRLAPLLNEKMRHFANTHENCFFVSAEGLTSNPDGLHFNAVSQRIFGFRYYEAFKALKNLEQPFENEAALLEELKGYQEKSIEEKIEDLKKQKENGSLSSHEYRFQLERLISMM